MYKVKAFSVLFFWSTMSLTTNGMRLYGYDLPTHQIISDRAVTVSSLQIYLRQELGLARGVDELILGRSVSDWITLGARLEDIPATRVRHHFHNPLRPWAQAGLTFGIQTRRVVAPVASGTTSGRLFIGGKRELVLA